MISTAEVVRRITGAPGPVLLPDTCALLDLMRDPTRDAYSADQVEAAHRLLTRATARPRTLWVVVARQVLDERAARQPDVKDEARVAIRKFEERIHRVQRIMAAHRLHTTAIAPSLVASNFPDVGSGMVDQVVGAGLHVRNPAGVTHKSYARIAANRAPSKRGQQAKDCLIIETYLHVARLLRAEGFHDRIVFFTTNTRDYSDAAASGTLHPDLVGEFAALSMLYAVNFQMVEHFVR